MNFVTMSYQLPIFDVQLDWGLLCYIHKAMFNGDGVKLCKCVL